MQRQDICSDLVFANFVLAIKYSQDHGMFGHINPEGGPLYLIIGVKEDDTPTSLQLGNCGSKNMRLP